MTELFRGWRPRVGFATLCLALALVLLWIRSIFVYDHILIVQGDNGHLLHFDSGGFLWAFDRGGWGGSSTDWTWGSQQELNYEFKILATKLDFVWEIRGLADAPYLIVYYWQPLIPLTLLSVYLLLVPSRKKLLRASQPHA